MLGLFRFKVFHLPLRQSSAWILFLLLAPLGMSSAKAAPYTVAESYDRIARERITFRAMSSSLNTSLAQVLETLFRLSDRVVVAKVSMLQWCETKGKLEYSFNDYQKELAAVREGFKNLILPAQARPGISSLLKVLEHHEEYFREWSEKVSAKQDFSEAFRPGRTIPAVLSKANSEVTAAERTLLDAFPQESEINRHAMRSHVAALRFP